MCKNPLRILLDAVQTIFYPNGKAKASGAMVAPLTRGMVLLHRFVLYRRYGSHRGVIEAKARTFYLDTVTSVSFTRVPKFEAAPNTFFARMSCS